MDHMLPSILAVIVVSMLAALVSGLMLSRSGFPAPDQARRLGRIDGLRGYLALFVLFSHFVIWLKITYIGGIWEPPPINLFNNLGAGGVALFFMTTGFLFYPRVLKGFRQVDWVATYIARLLRIYPLLVVSFAIVFLTVLVRIDFDLRGDWVEQTRRIILWLTTYAEPPLFGYEDTGRINAFVLWSLWYEWMFYVFVLPLLAVLRDVSRDRVPSWCIPASICVIAPLLSDMVRHPAIIRFLPLFAIGMLAYELRARPAIAAKLATPLAAVVACLGVSIAATVTHSPYDYPQVLLYGIFFICVACDNDIFRVFSLRGALVLGECSFAIYLLHGIVLDFLFQVILPAIGQPMVAQMLWTMPAATVVTVAVSGVAYLLIERPGIRAGRLLTRLATDRFRTADTESTVAPRREASG